MTLVSSIINSAYRDGNIVSIGRSPNAAEMAEGLLRLQSIVASVYGFDVGENLTDWPLGNYGRSELTQVTWLEDDIYWTYPPINVRLIATNEEAKTINLPVQPSDGSRMMIIDPYSRLATYPVTLDGNGRTIESAASVTLNTNGLSRIWFYNASAGNWSRVSDFTSTDQMPFPVEFDDYFITALAMRLDPSVGKQMPPESIARFKQQQSQIFARYAQSAPLAINPDLTYMSKQSYRYGWNGVYSSEQAFNSGWPDGYWPF